jgi:hypothetical protein
VHQAEHHCRCLHCPCVAFGYLGHARAVSQRPDFAAPFLIRRQDSELLLDQGRNRLVRLGV